MTKIAAYAVSWNIVQNRGAAAFKLADGQQVKVEMDSAQELYAIHELLRSGLNAGYDPATNSIGTDWRPPGA